MEKYNDKQKWALERLNELIQKIGSQNKVAELVGIKAAVLSPLRTGKYLGDVNSQFDKLIAYFSTKEEAAQNYDEVDYVPTSISQNIYEVIRNCQVKGGLAIACGDAGIGKTKAAKKFAADHPNNSIYIALNPCIITVKALLKVLCNRVNVSEKTIDDMWLGLANKLRDGQVIIFDESQHMPIKSIEAIRSLTDYFYEQGQTLGVCFIGNSETVNNFGGKKKAEFAQISNRTKQKRKYFTTDIKREDIQLLFPLISSQKPIVDLLFGIAQSSQALRGATNLFSNAYDNENFTYEGLVAMAKHMDIRLVQQGG